MPAAAAIIPAVISAGVGIYQTAQANKQARASQKAMQDYQRQDLDNPAEAIQVSTLGADIAREDLARNMATTVNNAAQGGSRAVIGVTPQLIAQNQVNEQQIMANLDMQEKERQRAIAQGNFTTQQLMEQRENNDLLGIGNQYAVAQQNRANGANILANTAISLMGGMSSGMFNGVGQNMFSPKPTQAISVPQQGVMLPSNSISVNAPTIQTNPSIVGYNPFLMQQLANKPI